MISCLFYLEVNLKVLFALLKCFNDKEAAVKTSFGRSGYIKNLQEK